MKYTKEEKSAIEKVLDIGFILQNSNGDVLLSIYGDYEITFHNGTIKTYTNSDTAIYAFYKKHN